MVVIIFIYKITNTVNNKVYIGQSIRPIEQRFKRHINDAINNKLDTHFARAIRKYGADNFVIEQIDSASSQDELNQKEQYWIRFYNSTVDGYNETDAIYKCGGNTYKSKTDEEMTVISDKLSISKTAELNPNARKIKCLNTVTGEELFFDTVRQCQEYFSEKTHRFITTRVSHKTRGLYLNIWDIAYIEDEYSCSKTVNKRGKELAVEDLETNNKIIYESVRLACRECGIDRNKMRKYMEKSNEFMIDNYKFTVLN